MPLQDFEITQFKGLAIHRSTTAFPNTLLELSNAMVDIEGVIRSRNGALRINAAATSDGAGSFNIHSHILHGSQRYLGVGSVIKRGIETASTNIVSGLSGDRVSFVRMAPSIPAGNLQHTYFANAQAAARKKDNGTTTSNFGMDGPTASAVIAVTPVSTAGQPTTTAIDDFSGAHAPQDGFGTDAAASSPYATSARAFTVPATKNERFRATFADKDLSGSGEDAFIRVMLRVDNRQNLDHVEVALALDTGAFTTDYFHLRISPFEFEADNSWQEFKFPKNIFEREKTTGGSALNWNVVDGVQITVGANSKGQVVVSADDMRMEANTHADGTHDYKITLWNDTLKTRSNSRRLADIYTETLAITGQVTVHRQRITLARPSDFASWDPQATHWEAWRRNVLLGDGEWHFVSRATVATTTITDDFADTALGEALLEINHIPPASKFILGPFDNRMFFLGMSNVTSGSGEEEAPYAFRWSESGYPESCPFANYGLAGSPVDGIQAGCIWAESLILFTKARVYRVRGLQGTYIASPTEAPIGTTCPYSVSPSPHGVFYFGYGGVYLFTGGTSVCISAQLEPLFRGETFTLDGVVISPINLSSAALLEGVVGTFFEDRYILTITTAAGGRLTLFYDLVSEQWHVRSNATAQSGWAVQRLAWERTGSTGSQADNLEAGTSDGWLMLLDSSGGNSTAFTDGGAASIPFAVQLKAWDTELKPSGIETDIKDIVVDVLTGGQSLTVQVSFDGAAYVSLGTVSTSVRDKVYLPVNGGVGTIAFRAAVRLTGSLSTARVTLFGVGTTHIPEPQRVLDFSTDYDQQGYAGEKLLQELQIEALTFGAAVIVTVEADGADLAQTFSLNTSVRRSQVFSFTIENPIATSFRLKFNGSTEWKLYNYVVQFLKEPLRVTVLETEMTNDNYPAEKLLQELQVESNTFGGNVNVVLEVDGVNLAQTFTLNTATRRSQVFSFTIENPIATRWRFKFTGAAPFKLYNTFVQWLKEPLRVTILETEAEDAGHFGEKYLQSLELEANTYNANALVTIEADGVNLAQTFVLNTAARRARVFAFTIEEPLATILRLKITCATPFKLYKSHFTFLPEPLRVDTLETVITDNGFSAEKYLQVLVLDINTFNTPVRCTVEADGVDLDPVFLPNSTKRNKEVLSFLIPKPLATLTRLKLESPSGLFKYYGHEFLFHEDKPRVHRWETAVSDEGHAAPKIFQELVVQSNTFAGDVDLIVEIDGVNTHVFNLNTTKEGGASAHLERTFSFPVPHPRGTNFRLKLSGNPGGFKFYGYRVQFIGLPLTILKIETAVSTEGFDGPKIFRQVEVELQTFGQPVLASILVDNIVVETEVLNTGTAHTTRTITMATSPEGRAVALRLEAQSTTPFTYYSHKFVGTVNQPSGVTVFDSTPFALFGSRKGWLGSRAYVVVRGAAPIIGTIYFDGISKATLTIPAQAARASVLVILPIGVFGRLARITFTSTAPFQIWPDSFIEAHAYDKDREMEPWRFVQ